MWTSLCKDLQSTSSSYVHICLKLLSHLPEGREAANVTWKEKMKFSLASAFWVPESWGGMDPLSYPVPSLIVRLVYGAEDQLGPHTTSEKIRWDLGGGGRLLGGSAQPMNLPENSSPGQPKERKGQCGGIWERKSWEPLTWFLALLSPWSKGEFQLTNNVSTHSIFFTISGSSPFTKSTSSQIVNFRVNKIKWVKMCTYEYASGQFA